MSISRFPGHMRSIKLNFSAIVLTLGLKAKIYEDLRKFKTLLSESFGWNCARATRLTAVCTGTKTSKTQRILPTREGSRRGTGDETLICHVIDHRSVTSQKIKFVKLWDLVPFSNRASLEKGPCQKLPLNCNSQPKYKG